MSDRSIDFDRPTDMPKRWPDGMLRSSANVFAAAYFVRVGSPAQARPAAKRGPKTQPASIVLPGTNVVGRRVRDLEAT